jgi:hypothetical protein
MTATPATDFILAAVLTLPPDEQDEVLQRLTEARELRVAGSASETALMLRSLRQAADYPGEPPSPDAYRRARKLLALLRDEERAARRDEYTQTIPGGGGLAPAASAVLVSTGEPSAWVEVTGTAMGGDELQRIMDRANFAGEPADLHPMAYRDRHGEVHLPLAAAAALAQAFAAAEPQTVIGYLDDYEEELRLKGNRPGERWYHERLRELGPGHALVRQWAGLEQEAEMFRKEISRLCSLVSTAAYELRSAGRERSANRLSRALEGR